MMSEVEIRAALVGWTAAHTVMQVIDDKPGEMLAEGYVRALEMVLRGTPEPKKAGKS